MEYDGPRCASDNARGSGAKTCAPSGCLVYCIPTDVRRCTRRRLYRGDVSHQFLNQFCDFSPGRSGEEVLCTSAAIIFKGLLEPSMLGAWNELAVVGTTDRLSPELIDGSLNVLPPPHCAKSSHLENQNDGASLCSVDRIHRLLHSGTQNLLS